MKINQLEMTIDKIDSEMLILSNWIWNYMCKKTKKGHNLELAIWKIER